jgi:hypothetical protein
MIAYIDITRCPSGATGMLQSAAQRGRFILFAGCAAALLVTAGALRADLLVSHGFNKAFGAYRVAPPFDAPQQAGAPSQSGSLQHGEEVYSLTRADVESPTPFAKNLAIGDRITISSSDGRPRVLEVVDLKAIGEPLTRIAADSAPLRLLLVTCRLVGVNDAKPIRFVIEGEAAVEALPPPAPTKAL